MYLICRKSLFSFQHRRLADQRKQNGVEHWSLLGIKTTFICLTIFTKTSQFSKLLHISSLNDKLWEYQFHHEVYLFSRIVEQILKAVDDFFDFLDGDLQVQNTSLSFKIIPFRYLLTNLQLVLLLRRCWNLFSVYCMRNQIQRIGKEPQKKPNM